MNNKFQEYADDFLDANYDENDDESFEDEELDSRIRAFLATKGIDEAWMEEAVEVVREYFQDNC
jgi:hypothetical protein